MHGRSGAWAPSPHPRLQVGRQAWISNHNVPFVTPELISFGVASSVAGDVHFYTDGGEGTDGPAPVVLEAGGDIGHQATLFPGARVCIGSVLGAKSNLLACEELPPGAVQLVSSVGHCCSAVVASSLPVLALGEGWPKQTGAHLWSPSTITLRVGPPCPRTSLAVVLQGATRMRAAAPDSTADEVLINATGDASSSSSSASSGAADLPDVEEGGRPGGGGKQAAEAASVAARSVSPARYFWGNLAHTALPILLAPLVQLSYLTPVRLGHATGDAGGMRGEKKERGAGTTVLALCRLAGPATLPRTPRHSPSGARSSRPAPNAHAVQAVCVIFTTVYIGGVVLVAPAALVGFTASYACLMVVMALLRM